MKPLVSILIPAYNAERWLRDTIISALGQIWPKKEIIIVDDGSSDDTLSISRRFASTSVKVINQENAGASAARNRALKDAQGDYIQWLDADDLLAPNKIEKQLEGVENGSNLMLPLTSAFGKFYFRHQKARFVANRLWQDLAPVEWLVRKFEDNAWMANCVWLVSRQLTELTGSWDERLSLDDDGEYFCRLVSKSEGIRFIEGAESYYRIGRIQSLSRSVDNRAMESLFLSTTLCIDHLRSLEDSERTRSACLKFLRVWLFHFCPEGSETGSEKNDVRRGLLRKIDDFARQLGGTLSLPQLSWKYYMTKKILGREVALEARNMFSNAQLIAKKNWDRVLHLLSL